jgi:hypothetical protein
MTDSLPSRAQQHALVKFLGRCDAGPAMTPPSGHPEKFSERQLGQFSSVCALVVSVETAKDHASPLRSPPRRGPGWVAGREAVGREPAPDRFLLTANLTGIFDRLVSWVSKRPSSLAMSLPYVEKRQNQIRVFERQQQRPSTSGTGSRDELSRESIRSRTAIGDRSFCDRRGPADSFQPVGAELMRHYTHRLPTHCRCVTPVRT